MSKIDDIAKQFSDAVRDAFILVYGPPGNPENLRAVCPTWSDHGIAVGWHEPDPGVVLVFSEYGWIRDPWSHDPEQHKMWEQAMDLLKRSGWDNVSFESINAGVHYVYWMPPDEWQKILNKRIRDKMR